MVCRVLVRDQTSGAGCVVATGLLLVFVIPALPSYQYSIPEAGHVSCVTTQRLEYCVDVYLRPNQSYLLPLGEPEDMTFRVWLFNDHLFPVPVTTLSLNWSSQFFVFNVSRTKLGPTDVPAAPGVPNQRGGTNLDVSVRVLPIRSSALATNPSLPPVTRIRFELLEDENNILFDFDGLVAAGPPYVREAAWAVALGLAALPWSARIMARVRRKRT